MPRPTPVLPFMRSDVVLSAGPKTTSATSLTRVVGLIWMAAISSADLALASARTSSVWLRSETLPAGASSATLAERGEEIADGQIAGRQRVGIDDDADQRIAVAVELHVGDAFDGGKAVDDVVVDDLRQLLDRQRRRGRREAHDRVGVGVGLDDGRRIGVVGKVAEIADGIAEVVGGDVEVGRRIELDGDAALAGDALRGDRDDARRARDGALDQRR